nr:hypothetical protein [Flavobacterium covae]
MTPVKEVVKQDLVKIETKNKVVDNQKVIFKIQLKASNMQIDIKPENFNGLSSISSVFEGGYYKYMYGETNDYQESRKMLIEAKTKGYESAFIVPYKNGTKITLNEAVKSAK